MKQLKYSILHKEFPELLFSDSNSNIEVGW